MAGGEMIDKGKLSQRELLILLNDKVEGMTKSVDGLRKDYIDLHVRVAKIETRQQTLAAAWGTAAIFITLFINFFKAFKNVN